MLKIRLTIIILTIFSSFSGICRAQFYTIQKTATPEYILLKEDNTKDEIQENQTVADSTAKAVSPDKKELFRLARHKPKRNSQQLRRVHLNSPEGLPALTIENLVREIRKNNIKHPKIVLAQAILETGWFQSNVCRTKNNLFGLTNPRTGQYYEFNHWTESVAAYYSKVQYRYKGGNYLLWLKKIGYAEAPDYIQSLARILNQYMLD